MSKRNAPNIPEPKAPTQESLSEKTLWGLGKFGSIPRTNPGLRGVVETGVKLAMGLLSSDENAKRKERR